MASEVEKLLTVINSCMSMRKESVSWVEMMDSMTDMKKYNLDFVDALILQTMKRNNVKEICTNDRDFERVDWVRRVWG